MNNEETKVEENLPRTDSNESEVKGQENESTNKEVNFITKRIPLKNWGKSYIDRCITIYNIDYATTEEELLAVFKQIEGFEKMFLLKDPQHPEFCNRGIAYVAYEKAKSVELALKELNHTLIGNRRIRIERSFEQELKAKQKLLKKDSINDPQLDHSLNEPEDPFINEPDHYTHSRHQEHHRRSRRSVHPEFDRVERAHRHYRHHRLPTNQYEPEYEYLDSQIPPIGSHPKLQIVSSAPLFHDYQKVSPPASRLYVNQPQLPPKVDNEVEDKANELSILFELYRDALLTQNISDMNDKKNTQ